jgi:hypothetical protein
LQLPATLTLNAFTGDPIEVAGKLSTDANRWGARSSTLTQQKPLAPPEAASPADWTSDKIGWGVVLPDDDTVSAADKALAKDAPEPVQRLVQARGNAPVLRYREDLGTRKLARYFEDGSRQDPEIGLSMFGTARGRLPLYLLIVASPTWVPWSLQFSLNRRHHVGRLDLSPEGLANYVDALLTDWSATPPTAQSAVVWSVSFDSITQMMDATIANRIHQRLTEDTEMSVIRTTGDAATGAHLIDDLEQKTPAVVVTSSHGKTGPLEDSDAMRRDLGLPVDVNRDTLDVEELVSRWNPSGAIWYAQACCSAGSDDGTSYDGLLDPDTLAAQVVAAVGNLGAQVAPLPARLLGAPEPLRAFIGHVEPTFDWTLRATDTGQELTGPLVTAISPNLYRRCPLGLAMDSHYRGVGDLYGKVNDALKGINSQVAGARETATYYRLTATDRESIVILGDPTVALPPLPSQISEGVLPKDCDPDL